MKPLAAAALVLAASGCGGHASPSSLASGRQTGSAGDLNGVPLADLRAAMPGREDFPKEWQTQSQTSPPALLPGLNGADTGIGSVEPAQCLDFAAAFVSVPGSSAPGEFVSVVTAALPSGMVSVLAVRTSREWESPAQVRDSLRDCPRVAAELSIGGKANAAAFVSSPIDTSAIRADAAGRATVISAGDDSAAIAVVRARARGVLVAATAYISPGPGDDQRALLVRLVGQTVDKLNSF